MNGLKGWIWTEKVTESSEGEYTNIRYTIFTLLVCTIQRFSHEKS